MLVGVGAEVVQHLGVSGEGLVLLGKGEPEEGHDLLRQVCHQAAIWNPVIVQSRARDKREKRVREAFGATVRVGLVREGAADGRHALLSVPRYRTCPSYNTAVMAQLVTASDCITAKVVV